MTMQVDPRSGSGSGKNPVMAHLPPLLCALSPTFLDADIEFAGNGPDEMPILPIGIEVKSISDCLTSMTDGRLADQVRKMLAAGYVRVYLVIYGQTKVSDDGILQTLQFDPGDRQYHWLPARGRKGEGWTSQEFWGRISSLEEFGGVRVKECGDIKEAAQWITSLYRYWQKDYSDHKSMEAWNQSGNGHAKPANLLLPTSELPLVQHWARDLPGIGQDKSKYVAQHFKSARALAMATDRDWEKVRFAERIKTGPNKGKIRYKKMSTETAREIVDEINKEIV